MKRLLPLLLAACAHAFAQIPPVPEHPVYLDPQAPLEARVDDLARFLTPDEKIQLLRAKAPYLFSVSAIERLHVPRLSMVDAGQGVRGGEAANNGPATLFAPGVLLASSWDTDLARRVGQGIAEEARNKGEGAQVLLAPGINIHRTPLAGRNGEYFSEDPYLSARLAVAYIQGVQSTGVAACVKHFACNNEEVDRSTVDVQVSERALREIYLYAFEAAVKEGHSWSIMSSYNRLRGEHATHNRYLLLDILRKDWGFDGAVISDWAAVHQTEVFATGNDLDMAYGAETGTRPEQIQAALARGTLTPADIDFSVRNILRLELRTGLFDPPRPRDPAVVDSAAHDALSLEAAEKGIVLLKNQSGLLPLDSTKVHSLALIGRGMREMQLGAEGSPHVTPARSTQPFDGITRRAGDHIAITYVSNEIIGDVLPASAVTVPNDASQHGFHAEYFSNSALTGPPQHTQVDPVIAFDWAKTGPGGGLGAEDFSVRWTAKLVAPVTGKYTFVVTADDGCRLSVDGRNVIDHWRAGPPKPQAGEITLEQGHTYDLSVDYMQVKGAALATLRWFVPRPDGFAEAAAAAKACDVAIVCVTTYGTEKEGADRANMSLPLAQDDLIRAVVAANPRTVVILNNGTPIDMSPWLDQTPALLEAWFPGQQGGQALAAILFGDVNPSGKLPDTLAVHREDYPDFGNYPGTNGVVKYLEGIYVGYRHFDQKNITPAFPFGHGLSYTTFAYSGLHLSAPRLLPGGTLAVSVDVTNTGSRAGDEIVQLYLADPHPKIDKAPRELKGFARVSLQPGEKKTVTLTLTPRDFAYCDVPNKQWKADAGSYDLIIGASSRDARQQTSVVLDRDFAEAIPAMLAP